jgi:hypothetical protein
MPLIERLFPQAEIVVIHLSRNPAASIASIEAAWLHRGYYSRNLQASPATANAAPNGLDIDGYSHQGPWARWWWNLDLPPGWHRYRSASLLEVAAFQWSAAHRAVAELEGKERIRKEHIRFESMTQGSFATRRQQVERLLRTAGGDPRQLGKQHDFLASVVQATTPPRPGKWRRHRDRIANRVHDPLVAEVSESLGYPLSDLDSWP